MDVTEVTQRADELRARGLRTLTGVISDTGGVMRAKSVPAARIESFALSGMGASLTWPQFCVDNGVAMTEEVGVVGDLRLTADLSTAVILGKGIGWAVADVRDQEGQRSPFCWRDVLRRQTQALSTTGIECRVGHEMEFVLTDLDGRALGEHSGWPCYGAGVYLELGEFAADLCDRLQEVGIAIEQIHAEYGLGQFELSLPPLAPLAAGDSVLLARSVIGMVAREHGMLVSFSPVPFAGGSGNGAHLHLSFSRDGVPLLSGGGQARGLHPEGAQAISGIVSHLPSTIAVVAGTVVSGERMQPGHWSGAWACWGVENREAAVRVLSANNGNPHGANVEVKCVDAGANPWLSTGLILGLARHGIENQLPLPQEVTTDPALLTDAEKAAAAVVRLPSTSRERLALFESDEVVRDILGAPLHEAVLAIRRREENAYEGKDVHAHTRFAWSS